MVSIHNIIIYFSTCVDLFGIDKGMLSTKPSGQATISSAVRLPAPTTFAYSVKTIVFSGLLRGKLLCFLNSVYERTLL